MGFGEDMASRWPSFGLDFSGYTYSSATSELLGQIACRADPLDT